jgi:DNA polymerase III delta' subunit
VSSAGDIVGHESQREVLLTLLASERLPSTIMLSGARGIGKQLVAGMLARAVLCTNRAKSGAACGACKSCALFDSGNHPDFTRVEALDRDQWNIEAIRRMLYSLSLAPYLGAARVVIINDAEYLSEQAANALLKSLEEPRPGMYFIIVSANPSRLPQTLLSRCQSWFFARLTDEQTRAVLAKSAAAAVADLSARDREDLVMLAEGSPGTVAELAGALELWRVLGERTAKIFAGDVKEALDLSAELGKDRERLRAVLQLFRVLARRNMRAAMRERSSEEAQRKWAAFLANSITAERLIFERNLGGAYVLSHILLALVNDRELNSFTALTNSASFLETVVR